VYLELRTTPKEREGMTKESYVQAVLNGITLAGEELQDQRYCASMDLEHKAFAYLEELSYTRRPDILVKHTASLQAAWLTG